MTEQAHLDDDHAFELERREIEMSEQYPNRRYDRRDGWIAARVGCHWMKGPYTISTICQGPRWGYAVYRQSIRADNDTYDLGDVRDYSAADVPLLELGFIRVPYVPF